MLSVSVPTPELVVVACSEFDSENNLAEGALEELFKQYPSNTNINHVLLKVVAVNTLYRTNIYAVERVAEHIFRNVPNLDQALQSGDVEIVEKISKIRVGIAEREVNFFSFASKFCSWHFQSYFPIYDARVERYLWNLHKQHPFSDALHHREDLWSYPKFFQIVSDFRTHFGLEGFSFKQIDKFLYAYGAPNTPEDANGTLPVSGN